MSKLERKGRRAYEGTMYCPSFQKTKCMISDLPTRGFIQETYLEKFLTLHDKVTFFFSLEFIVVCKADDVE